MGKRKDPDIITSKSKTAGRLGDYVAPRYDGSLESMVQLIREPEEKIGDTRRRVVELLKGEEDMVKLCETFEVLRRRGNHNTTSLDKVVEFAGINRSDAFGAIARVLHRYSFDVTRTVIAAVAARHAGRVAIAMANCASHPEGIADRRLFMDIARVTSTSGGGVTVNVPVTNTAVAQAKADMEGVNPGGRALPEFESGVKQLGASLRTIDASRAG
jgi:hypothetical protein